MKEKSKNARTLQTNGRPIEVSTKLTVTVWMVLLSRLWQYKCSWHIMLSELYLYVTLGRSRYRYCATVWGLVLRRGKKFFSAPKIKTGCGSHPAAYSIHTRSLFFWRQGDWSMKKTTLHPIGPKLTITGDINQLPAYAFMAWTNTTLHFYTFISYGNLKATSE